ncbi:MAG: SDR family oxidoreductase [Acidimicrobiales bacterium]|nr:SDR family oxidoreductase [Acidimicrobiales bacterium]MCB1016282.1 SDR family oxidoreductase [Acidimicrobiales bacterium]MCB9373584.1 SDR family oxidoreductase [Microthrixaceae bacterium]
MAGGARTVAGRVAVVTGAASGIGRAVAALLADDGATVAALDLVEPGSPGGAGRTWACDVTDAAQVDRVLGQIRADLGPVDVLVNCAGVSLPAGIDAPADAFDASWDRTLAVNLTAMARMVRACVDDLRRDGEGRVVNIASSEALGATAFLSAYTASKHGVVGLTRALAVELGRAGVTVNAVCPGPIHTGMTAVIPDDAKATFARRRVPAGRYGEPEEVAHAVWSLVLPGASYVNGAVLSVDGGMTAQNT